jgi:hypothetical protein
MDELARLITSLTKSEKRYFKMMSAIQGGEKSYLKLFEAIEKNGDYDEEKIRKTFANEEFIKRLPSVKNYLYHQILKSLRANYGGSTIDSQLKAMMEEVAILFDKRLYKQCIKILERAKELGQTNELVLHLIEINAWEEKVLIETLSLDKFEKFLNNSLKEEVHLLELQKNVAEYRILFNKINLINRQIKEARTEEELNRFESIINNPFLKSIDTAKSFDARNYFYIIHLIYNHAKGDHEACLSIAEKQLFLIESYPTRIKEKPQIYISALNNILLSDIHLHRYDNFMETLTKLRDIPDKSLSNEVRIFVSSYTFEMVMYLDTGEFHKGLGIVDEIMEGLKKYHDRINVIEEITLLYNLFYLYFGTGEFSKALGIINKLLNEYQKELRYDIQSAVRILNLILHFELGNTTLLDYNAISTYRFLYKSKRLYKLENIVLNFIRKKMPGIYTQADQIEAFRELRQEFIELSQDPFEQKAFEYFDYISWLDSKIEGRSFEEVVKQKFQEKYLTKSK